MKRFLQILNIAAIAVLLFGAGMVPGTLLSLKQVQTVESVEPVDEVSEVVAMAVSPTNFRSINVDHDAYIGGVTTANGGVVGDVTGAITGDVTGNLTGDVTGDVTGILTGTVTGDVTGNLTGNVTGNITGTITTALNLESFGAPSVLQVPITYTAAAGGTGAAATVTDGEIWFVWGAFVNVTTDFDCTGDDATFVLGDSNDADGFVVLADANLQAAATEQTGSPAGWQGLIAATMGVYLDGAVSSAPQIYAPSGGDITIDWLVDEASGETLTAGAMTIYIIYTRVQ